MRMRERRRVYNPVGSPFSSPKAVTQQHLKTHTDINEIVAKAKRGIAPTYLREPGKFLDLSKAPHSLDEAFSQVQEAYEMFETLPAKAREELNNDPRNLVLANKDFLEKHGLLKSSEKPLAGPVLNSEAAKAPAGACAPRTASKAASSKPKASVDESDQD